MPNYNRASRLLHRLALGSSSIAEISFDMERALSGGDIGDLQTRPHVFVSGLARAGTTILLRELHKSKQFASLTYRDMPFVLAPNIWAKISGRFARNVVSLERAHRDGIYVDYNSPEAFEEVFWRTHDADAYILKNVITEHTPSEELLDLFCQYIFLILKKYSTERYLSKNNNNIVRLPALTRRFSNAVFLVPFRYPFAHAASLMEQHKRFTDQPDNFVKNYMRWLGHYEFGHVQKPFSFTGSEVLRNKDPFTLDYWLELWIAVYEHLLTAKYADDSNLFFVCYEDLNANQDVWLALCKRCGIEISTEHMFINKNRTHYRWHDGRIAQRAMVIYDQLRERATKKLLCK